MFRISTSSSQADLPTGNVLVALYNKLKCCLRQYPTIICSYRKDKILFVVWDISRTVIQFTNTNLAFLFMVLRLHEDIYDV